MRGKSWPSPLSAQRQEDVAMSVRSRYLVAAALGLCMAHPLPAQEPGPLPVDRGPAVASQVQPSFNQQTANAIADRLRESGQLRHYAIDVSYRDGTADLRGSVADQPQREEAMRLVQGVPGVERVLDHLSLAGGEAITQTQALTPPPPAAPVPSAEPPLAPPPGPSAAGGPAEPLPLFAAPQPGPYDVGCPKMPPYAWPTYAPYNNYSRVAYPEAYPYNAWPFIGPVYPFPKIPLGWRSVKLEWQDGYWWFSKVATKHDWWRLRYW
jgi:hypothetical protein